MRMTVIAVFFVRKSRAVLRRSTPRDALPMPTQREHSNGSLPVRLLPRRRATEACLAQRRAGRGVGLPQHRALRIYSGRGPGAQSLAAHAASRRAGLWRPRLRQPGRAVAPVRGSGQASRALHRVALDVGDRDVSRDPRRHGSAALGIHEPRLLQHALPLGLWRAGGARGHRAQQGHAPAPDRPQAARLVLARRLQHAEHARPREGGGPRLHLRLLSRRPADAARHQARHR